MHFTRTANGVRWTGAGETLQVDAWGPDGIRVRGRVQGPVLDTDWALLPGGAREADVVIEGGTARVRNGGIRVVLTSEEERDWTAGYTTFRCALRFEDAAGRVLLEELREGVALKRTPRGYRPLPGGAHHLTVAFAAHDEEHLVGMGLYQQDRIDLKGSSLELAHRNSQASVPFVLSNHGYGFLWHQPAIGRATFAQNRTEWVAEATEQLDYWVTAGVTPAAISEHLAAVVGSAPEMPEHGLGFWQSRLRYWNQEQLLEVAREYAGRGLPLDVVVADFFHWPKMGDYRFEPEFWPDVPAMVAELRAMGTELMVSVWPQVSLESENYAEFRRRNGLVKSERGPEIQMGFEGPSAFVDPTSPGGSGLLWDRVRANYHEHGVRTFWLDEAEPEYGVYDFDNYRYWAGPALQVGNIYPQRLSRTFWDGQRDAGQDQVVNLVRCAWLGSQRYGALVWSGDIGSSFADLRRQVTAGIHLGVAGIPWFTTDIGGFHGGRADDPAFVELLIRWFQFGAFCPVMRLHGDRGPSTEVVAEDGTRRSPTGAPNEIWSFGPEAEAVLTDHLRLRQRLRPYLRSVMTAAHRHGQPVMRGLFHEFPDDRRAWTINDEFLLGSDVLVAPVLEAGARERTVYLPQGSDWIDVATGATHGGGTTVSVEAPLDRIPVFTRNASLAETIRAH